MLFLKSWLADYINLQDYTNSEIIAQINQKSAEVDGVEEVTDYFGGRVLVGRIENLRPHPNADKLNIFDVDLGPRGRVQIVSAAPNARNDLLVPVALDGAVLPDLTIQAKPLRGEKSEGMCCGKSELLLETGYSAGLWELNDEFAGEVPLGVSICQALPQYFPVETVFDISVLPNRIGVFGSHLGFAQELALILERPELLTDQARALLDPERLISQVNGEDFFSEEVSELSFEFRDEAGLTNSFGLFDLELETEFALDKDLKRRMFLAGINLVGNVTDLSNYLLFDIGQPTHFFARDKVASEEPTLRWSVRRLAQSQGFKGLGQLKKTTLPKNLAVLENERGQVLALPGVSGSNASKIDNDTRVVVEIANFEADEIARAAFALKYRSDAAKVWAGRVNQLLTLTALVRLRQLLPAARLQLVSVWKNNQHHSTLEPIIQNYRLPAIPVTEAQLATRLDSRPLPEWGTTLEDILGRIGRYDSKAGTLTPEPSYSNLSTFEDVFEDVARLLGFDSLRAEYLASRMQLPETKTYRVHAELRRLCVRHGLDEVITRPFVQEDELRTPEQPLELQKAQNATAPYVRDSLFPSLLSTVAKNLLSGYKRPAIFELNQVYHSLGNGSLAGAQHLDAIAVTDEAYNLTTLLHRIFQAAGLTPEITALTTEYGQGYRYDTKSLTAELVAVKNSHKKKAGVSLSKTLYYLHLDLTNFAGSLSPYPRYEDESEYPLLNRCYSFDLDPAITWAKIQEVLTTNTPELRTDLLPLERRHLPTGDTLTVSVDFVSHTGTLSGSKITAWEEQTWPQLKTLGRITLR